MSDTSSSIEDILTPKNIIFSGGGKRFVSTKGDADFDGYYAEVKEILGKVSEKTSKFTLTTEDEMLSAIKSTSVSVDFGTVFGGEIGGYIGTYFPAKQLKEVVISLSDSALGKPVVYIRDRADGEIYKTAVDVPLAQFAETVLAHLEKHSSGNLPFAFELGFHMSKQTEESEISQDILLNSNILIGLTDVEAPEISVSAPKNTGLTSSQASLILRQFGMDKTSARKYIETNDAIIYVDGGATLKISPTGTLEYTAQTEGPEIYNPSSKDALPVAVGNIFSYIRRIIREFDTNTPPLQISSDLVNLSDNTEEVTINIDYYINSIPVMAWENKHAITVTMKNGKLVSYTQQVCDLETQEEMLSAGNMLQAVDGLYETLPEGTKATVSDLFVAYTAEDTLSWCARLDSDDSLIIIDREGAE
ncbi:MAG: hypothetical protein IKW02_03650 [Clostridia bacterium]|nr:hypothetical protein [Clostridia bacterium]